MPESNLNNISGASERSCSNNVSALSGVFGGNNCCCQNDSVILFFLIIFLLLFTNFGCCGCSR